MNLDQFSGSVRWFRGALKARWGVLTRAESDVVLGRRNQLLGRIQQLRGGVRAASKTQLRQWQRSHNDLRTGLARER